MRLPAAAFGVAVEILQRRGASTPFLARFSSREISNGAADRRTPSSCARRYRYRSCSASPSRALRDPRSRPSRARLRASGGRSRATSTRSRTTSTRSAGVPAELRSSPRVPAVTRANRSSTPCVVKRSRGAVTAARSGASPGRDAFRTGVPVTTLPRAQPSATPRPTLARVSG